MFSDLPDNFFAQLLGLLSFALGVVCFMQKNDTRFKYFHILLNSNHSLHFFLMGSYTSAFATVISIIRTAASIKTSSKYAAYFFIVLAFIIGYFTTEAWYNWFSVIGASLGTYGLFCLSGIAMRSMLTLGCLCWLTNNILVGSIGGIMLETMVLIVNLSTMFRLYADTKAVKTSIE